MQLERLQATLTRVYKNVTFYKKKFDELGFLPEDCQSLEDLAAAALHHPPRPGPGLPLRDVCGAPPGGGAHPLLHRQPRQPHRHGLHQPGPAPLGQTGRPHPHRRRGGPGRRGPGDPELQPPDQRLRHPLRRGAPGGLGNPQRPRVHHPPGPGDAGLPHHRPGLHSVLRPGAGRRNGGPGGGPQEPPPQAGAAGRGALDRGHAGRNRGPAVLTALDHYALSEAMGPGVAGECAAHPLGGMHLSEDHFLPQVIDPATGELLPPKASWGNWSLPPSPGRPRPWCASVPATWCACSTSPAPAAAPWPA